MTAVLLFVVFAFTTACQSVQYTQRSGDCLSEDGCSELAVNGPQSAKHAKDFARLDNEAKRIETEREVAKADSTAMLVALKEVDGKCLEIRENRQTGKRQIRVTNNGPYGCNNDAGTFGAYQSSYGSYARAYWNQHRQADASEVAPNGAGASTNVALEKRVEELEKDFEVYDETINEMVGNAEKEDQ